MSDIVRVLLQPSIFFLMPCAGLLEIPANSEVVRRTGLSPADMFLSTVLQRHIGANRLYVIFRPWSGVVV
jgi:hypothetical protein